MNMRPTLALLIPAYNAKAFLPRLLASAQQQEKPFDEIWVYDDCSTDNTAELAEGLGAKVVRGATNLGCTSGKAALVEITTCDWIHFHDADDLILPGFVETCHRWMKADVADVVVFRCEERWEDTRDLIHVNDPDDELLASDPIESTIRQIINSSSGLYRRSIFASTGFDLDPEVLYNEDQAFHCKLARSGLRFRGDCSASLVYLRRRTSMSNANQAKCVRAHYHVMKKALEHPTGAAHKAAIAERLWHVVAGAAAYLDWTTADEAAALAMKIADPAVAPTGAMFKMLCRLSPSAAIRLREGMIRTMKPHFRDGYPGWRSPVSIF